MKIIASLYMAWVIGCITAGTIYGIFTPLDEMMMQVNDILGGQ